MIKTLTLSLILFTAAPASAGLLEFCELFLGISGQRATSDISVKNVGVTWAKLEQFWSSEFAARGWEFKPSELVLYKDVILTKCGLGQAVMGPFYCPADHKTYIDLGQLIKIGRRYGLTGEGAAIYILAHEYGHHVLNLTGATDNFIALRSKLPGHANLLSNMNELTVDGLAGYFIVRLKKLGAMGPADLKDALGAAASFGDDHVTMVNGIEAPSCGSHGTSAERQTWLRKGMAAKAFEEVDAFSDPQFLGRFPEALRASIAATLKTSPI